MCFWLCSAVLNITDAESMLIFVPVSFSPSPFFTMYITDMFLIVHFGLAFHDLCRFFLFVCFVTDLVELRRLIKQKEIEVV